MDCGLNTVFLAKIRTVTKPTERYPEASPGQVVKELPPRHLDLFTQAVLLLGDWVSQAGWGLLLAGSVFFWTTTVNSEIGGFGKPDIVWKKKAGVVLQADSTGTLEGGQMIWRYKHSVNVDGRRYSGESFSDGKKFDAGQIAFVQFDAADPSHNFLVGLRQKQFREAINWFLFVPLLMGLPLALWPLRANLKFIRLLKIGEFSRGAFMDKTATGRSRKLGGSVLTELRYEFRFPHEGKEYLATCRTFNTHLLEDEDSEKVLYDRFEPTFNLVYDAVPNVPKIGADGKMQSLELWRGWVLILPLLTVVGNLLLFWLR